LTLQEPRDCNGNAINDNEYPCSLWVGLCKQTVVAIGHHLLVVLMKDPEELCDKIHKNVHNHKGREWTLVSILWIVKDTEVLLCEILRQPVDLGSLVIGKGLYHAFSNVLISIAGVSHRVSEKDVERNNAQVGCNSLDVLARASNELEQVLVVNDLQHLVINISALDSEGLNQVVLLQLTLVVVVIFELRPVRFLHKSSLYELHLPLNSLHFLLFHLI
jgi:hypothetical protein